jgi:hypothetical protein
VPNLLAAVADLKSRLGLSDSYDDTRLTSSIEAASRRVESMCGRDRFWADSTVTIREVYPDTQYCARIPIGISTTTGLIVKSDTASDGTFATTLTINTDFLTQPRNAIADGRPIDELFAINGAFQVLTNGRAGLQVTAKFGWPSVPADVEEAVLILAQKLFKRNETSTGVIGFDGQGTTVRLSRRDPDVDDLLSPFVVYGIA